MAANPMNNKMCIRDRVVAGHEVGLVDVVRGTDGVIAEAQMADGHAAGLLGVILEVCLNCLLYTSCPATRILVRIGIP